MVPFFVQIKCQLGKSYEVANRLADAEVASEIYSTAGEFDLLVKVYVDAAPTSAISSTRRFKSSRAFRTRGRSSPSRRSELAHVGRAFGLADAAQPQLTLPPDHENAGCRDDDAADEDVDRRHLTEHGVAEHERPDHGGVVDRRDQRRRRVAIAGRQHDMSKPAIRPAAISTASCMPFGHIQPNGKVARPAARSTARIEHDRGRRLGVGQPPGLDHRTALVRAAVNAHATPMVAATVAEPPEGIARG